MFCYFLMLFDSGLPYEVNNEQALKHQEVVDKINQSLELLKQATEKVLSVILSSVHLIPYSMRYMAKVLKNSLREKFPQAPEKDILKVFSALSYLYIKTYLYLFGISRK